MCMPTALGSGLTPQNLTFGFVVVEQVWSNVAEKTPGSEGSAGGDFGGGGHGWSDQMPKGDRLPPGGLLPTLSKADEFGDGGLSTSHSPAPFGATAGSIISSAGRVKGSSSRPGTGTTAASGQSVDPSWERNDSDAAKLVKIEIRKGSKPLKRDGLFVVIPDVRATVNSPRLRKEPLSGPSSPPTHGSRGPGGGQNPVSKHGQVFPLFACHGRTSHLAKHFIPESQKNTLHFFL